MGDYDRIFKESIEQLILPLSQKLLGIEIQSVKGLSTTLSLTLERQPDFLKQVTDADGNVFILHLEFQSDNDKRMAARMLVYVALLYEKYQLPVKQYVIYLGRHKMTMSSELAFRSTQHRFAIIDLQQVSADQLLIDAEQPEEAVLSILTHFDEKEASVIIHRILNTLKKFSSSKRQLQRYAKQLEILSSLRNLQPETVKQIEAMALVYDIRKDLRYQQGHEEGHEEGLEEGFEKGREKERKEAQKQLAAKLRQEKKALAQRMKQEGVAIEIIARVSGLPVSQIEKL